MTGYLQRLAHSVATPVPRLRPLAGAFAGASSRDVKEHVEVASQGASSVVSQGRSDRPAGPVRVDGGDGRAGAHARPGADDAAPADGRIELRHAAPAAPSFEPIVETSRDAIAMAPHRDAADPATAREDASPSWTEPAPPPPLVEMPTGLDDGVHEEPGLRPAAPRGLALLPSQPSPRLATAQVAADAARAAPIEPRDIEIRIGRIEVVAVPPARPAPTQAPAPRHAVNLGDYLKTHQRGSR